MKMLFVAAATAALLSAPAQAGAAKREAVKLNIETSGVNFADPQSVDAFRARAARQIGVTSPDRQCRRELTAQLSRMVSTLAVASTPGAAQRN